MLGALTSLWQALRLSPNPDVILPWTTPDNCHHNVRAICDLEGLTYQQKQVLTACVKVESNFNPKAIHANYVINPQGVRELASTDFGIVQINDYYHIGPGKDFPSSQYVLANPEACVRYMARYYKQNGNLNPWCSYSVPKDNPPYLQWLGKV